MNVSEAVQVFILIYVLVIVGLYLSSRFWSPLLTKLKIALGLAAPASVAVAPPLPGDGLVSHSFRQGAPRPPKLRNPPVLATDDHEARKAYCDRLGLATRLVGYVASANPTGFPLGLYREWHAARWQAYSDDPVVDSEQAIAAAIRQPVEDDVAYAAVVAEFAAGASYAEMSDVVHFCGEAFVASKAGSGVHVRISALAETLAVAAASDSAGPAEMDEHDRTQLERKLEVDFLSEVPAKVAHLRRMHAFFRGRLIGLRDEPAAERRGERMADCRRHMEEHERLLGCFGFSP